MGTLPGCSEGFGLLGVPQELLVGRGLGEEALPVLPHLVEPAPACVQGPAAAAAGTCTGHLSGPG